MNKSELKKLIKEEIKKQSLREDFFNRDKRTSKPKLSPEKNERMFSNLKKKAEELYIEHHPDKKEEKYYGNIYPNKMEDSERDKYFSWFVAWGRALKTATTYNDLFKTLEILPKGLKGKFEDELGNIR